MDDRRHVWHDPIHPPNEIVSGWEGPKKPKKQVRVSSRVRLTLWVILWSVLGSIVLLTIIFLGSAVIAGITEGFDESVIIAPIKPVEEEALLGLAATIVDRGKRRDYASVLALSDGSTHVRAAELSQDVEAAFGGADVRDWEIDTESVQLLEDLKSQERIIAFRLVLIDAEGNSRKTGPFYAAADGKGWALTGIFGRKVKEVVY